MQPRHWIALRGSCEIRDGVLSQVATPRTNETGTPEIPFAEIRSDLDFESGTISLQAFLPHAEAKCQVILNSGRGTEVYVGLNVGKSAYGIALYRGGKWEHGASSGYGNQPRLQQWIDMEVRVIGSQITLQVDGVRVAEYNEPVTRSQLGLLLMGSSEVQVRNFDATAVQPIVFVVMQFTEEYNDLYRDVIRPVCEQFGYRVVRGDDSTDVGLIIEDIAKSIRQASVIIAEITPDNPNVYYEVGYAHALQKTTILLSDRKRARLPFDVSGFRTLFYDNTIGGKGAVESRLRQHLEAIAA